MCLLSFSLQHYFWQCILSPSRWLQLGWHHLLLLFHLLALAGAVGKTNLQGLSAPSSITICQTCKKKKKKGPRQRKCWWHWLQSLEPAWFKIMLHSGSSHGIRGGEGAQMCSFHLSPTFSNEDLSDWQIQKPSCKEQLVLEIEATLKPQRGNLKEQIWHTNPYLPSLTLRDEPQPSRTQSSPGLEVHSEPHSPQWVKPVWALASHWLS